MKETALLEALYSWDEFWRTVEMAWETFGDPRPLTQDDFIKGLYEEIEAPHGGWFLWPLPLAPLAYMSENDVIKRYQGRLPRMWVIYDHAHRVMAWLGFPGNEEPTWWLFAYAGGETEKLLPFIQHRSTGIIHKLLRKLGSHKGLVEELSSSRLPYSYPDASPPVQYNPRGPSRKPKYHSFDRNLLSPKYRQGLIPEPLDPLTIAHRKTLANYFKQIGALQAEYDLAKELEQSRQVMQEEIRHTLEHPLYQIIYARRFDRDKSTTERLATITKLARQCHEGEVSIETLLEWNWKSEWNKNLHSELAEAARNSQEKFQLKRQRIANKIYKQVHGWFRQRGWPMPKCPKNWRKEIIKL